MQLIKAITIPVSDTSVQLGREIKVIPGNQLRWGTTTITANANRFVVGLLFKYSVFYTNSTYSIIPMDLFYLHL